MNYFLLVVLSFSAVSWEERCRRRIGPVQLLLDWLLTLRALGFLLREAASAAWSRLERWPEYIERARREV